MIIGITGGRTYDNRYAVDCALVEAVSGHMRNSVVFVVGGAKGADTLAEEWARRHGWHVARVDALWDHNGTMAGTLRNTAMHLLKLDKLIAFPGGRGTADMVRKAKTLGVPVTEVA